MAVMETKHLFADRLSRVQESPTTQVMTTAQRLKAEGVDIVDLGVGEPDFNTPDNVKEAAKRAIDSNFTHYTPTCGVPELRDAVVARYRADFGIERTRREVIVTLGAKQAIFNALLAIVNEGDEVIIPVPYWVTFPQVVYFCGGTPVFVQASAELGFQITADLLKQYVTDRTKVIIINSPNNPTGAVIPPDEVLRISELAAERGIFLLCDECYQCFVYDGLQPCTAAGLPEPQRRWVIVAGSLSKTYAMTGWRIGYAIATPELVDKMTTIQGHQTGNPTSIAQSAAIEALNGPQTSVDSMIREYERRRNFLIPALNRIPGIRCFKPQGAFYAYPNIQDHLKGALKTCDDFAGRLLREARIASTPGSAFGTEGYIRISYAAAYGVLEEAVQRLQYFVSKL